ncbi:RNA polymerase sigma factor [Diaminobutyricibacter tongyongensis]|uniref:RNA polymerase sigma factor n=2 Tax=Leifsonia tongyongensis TaxID=1268043 RepID=A0A6L9XYD9_9MICO|nr:RNA polymerase sigma factor [Diaminobutyricibacter tongyongensis]
MDESADGTLLAAAINGDGQAFGRLYDRHRDRVFRHVLRLSDSRSDAEDLVALVFVEAWRRQGSVRVVEGSVLPWLLVTANNLARNERRARRRYRAVLPRIAPPVPEPDHADEIAERLGAVERATAVRSAFDRLGPRDQEILAPCVLDELSTSEVAATLGVPVGTVKSRLSRAKQRLAAGIDGDIRLDSVWSSL